MKRIRRFFGTWFGLAVVGCLVLAGWALSTGGLFDGPVAQELRGSSVYVAPEVDLDERAAERVIGNRKLTVAFMPPGTELSEVCDDVGGAADGTLVVPISRADDEYDVYPCARFTDDLGEALVSETLIVRGIDQFVDRPIEAVKIMAVQYDLLVKAGTISDGAREIKASAPRYLLAAAALAAVIGGAAIAYAGARRAGRLAAKRLEHKETEDDARSVLNADAAVLAQLIIDLDRQHASVQRRIRTGRASKKDLAFPKRYRSVITRYVELLGEIAEVDRTAADRAARSAELAKRVRELTRQGNALARD